MPGKMGDMNRTVLIPATWSWRNAFNASFGRWGTGFEMAAKCVVKGIDGKGDFDVFQLADQVDVPKNQVGLGDDGDIGPALRNCSSKCRVTRYCFSKALYGSVTELMTTFCPASCFVGNGVCRSV